MFNLVYTRFSRGWGARRKLRGGRFAMWPKCLFFVARKNVAREVQVLSMADVKWMRSVVCEDFKSSVHELMGMDQTSRLQTAESI